MQGGGGSTRVEALADHPVSEWLPGNTEVWLGSGLWHSVSG